MNCVTHPQTPATAFCRTCGKALCDECKRDVRGVIYCEDCIVARLEGTMPPAGAQPAASAAAVPGAAPIEPVAGAPNPALAAVLAGFFPFGIGQVYNGQFGKALVHLVTFALLIVATDNAHGAEPLFGMSIAFFYFYQIFDAYRTAHAKEHGQPPPDPGGIYKALGVQTNGGNTDSVLAGHKVPVAAIVLIGLGVLFLLHNMGIWWSFHIGRFWPLILIAVGIRMFMRNRPAGR
jgi:hypothetical protein